MSKDMKLIIERFEKARSEQMGAPILGMNVGVATAAGQEEQAEEEVRKKNRDLVADIAGLPSGETHIEIQYSDLTLMPGETDIRDVSYIENEFDEIEEKMNEMYNKQYRSARTAGLVDPFYSYNAPGRGGYSPDDVVIFTRYKVEPRIIAHCLHVGLKSKDLV